MKILENSGESIYFVKISADRDRRTGQRPEPVSAYGIKEVPTIIVENSALVGIDAFRWLANRLENASTSVTSVSTRQNKVTNPNYPGLSAEGNAESTRVRPVNAGLSDAEGGGSGNAQDGGLQPYSLSDNNSNFLQISDNSDTTIYTPDESDNIQKMGNFVLKNDNITAQAMNTNYPTNDDPNKPRITVKKDLLKAKQSDNLYNKLLEERAAMTPMPPMRM